MKKLFEFQCTACDAITEELTEYKTLSTCPECGEQSVKIISTPSIKLEGITGDFPGAYYAWGKKHREKLKQEQKSKDE